MNTEASSHFAGRTYAGLVRHTVLYCERQLEFAAVSGGLWAMEALGTMLFDSGAERERGEQWLQTAVSRGSLSALFSLGTRLLEREGQFDTGRYMG